MALSCPSQCSGASPEGASGRDSDVDLLFVLDDDVDRAVVEEALHDIAHDVELEQGLVLSLVVRNTSELRCQRGRPFLRAVREDAAVHHERERPRGGAGTRPLSSERVS